MKMKILWGRCALITTLCFVPASSALDACGICGFISSCSDERNAFYEIKGHISEIEIRQCTKDAAVNRNFKEVCNYLMLVQDQRLLKQLKPEREQFIKQWRLDRQKLIEELNSERDQILKAGKTRAKMLQQQNEFEQRKKKVEQQQKIKKVKEETSKLLQEARKELEELERQSGQN